MSKKRNRLKNNKKSGSFFAAGDERFFAIENLSKGKGKWVGGGRRREVVKEGEQ